MNNPYTEKRDHVPKRRKAQDNPYELFTVGIHTEHPHFFAQFVDSTGEMRCVEVSRSIYAALDRFELDDLSFLNEVDNHYEHSDLTESTLYQRSVRHQESVENTVMKHIQSENLHKAIATLPELQRRRLVLYFFGDYTYEQIGEMEGCSHQAINKAVNAAISNLKNILSE